MVLLKISLGVKCARGALLLLAAANALADPPPAETARQFGICENAFAVVRPQIEATPRFRIPIQHQNVRDPESLKSLKIATYNIQDAHLTDEFLGRISWRQNQRRVKKTDNLIAVIQTLHAMKPDVLVLQEVGSQSVLKYISRHGLANEYHAVMLPANDGRGFEVGFLIRRDLPFNVHYESHQGMREFSRDAPTLEFRPIGASEVEKPSFVIMGVHQKSMRSVPGDEDGSLRRAAQVKASLIIAQDYARRYGPGLPFLIAGDFNSNLHRAPELAPLFRHFIDAFDVLPHPPKESDRATQFYFNNDYSPNFRQFDGILVNSILQDRIMSAEVFPYLDMTGERLQNPRSFRERRRYPSDHRPVLLELSIHGL